MDTLIFMMALPALASFVCFIMFPPKNAVEDALRAFNWGYSALIALLTGIWALRMKYSFDLNYEEYQHTVGWVGAFGIITIGFGVGFVLRWWIFRAPKMPGGGMFG